MPNRETFRAFQAEPNGFGFGLSKERDGVIELYSFGEPGFFGDLLVWESPVRVVGLPRLDSPVEHWQVDGFLPAGDQDFSFPPDLVFQGPARGREEMDLEACRSQRCLDVLGFFPGVEINPDALAHGHPVGIHLNQQRPILGIHR